MDVFLCTKIDGTMVGCTRKKGGLMGISLQRSRKMGDEWHLGVIEDPWFIHMIAILNASESSPDHEVS